ncbi:RagB/SusD family nutrient uptake outer membrane protein [Pedobacter hiemivivus]|uniref:RagB/SusD family nutrient uptake outer membrane protein n=1 Tax=Pedobacter hiemivivus TaxID=2530454 RepID=A0A4U1FZ93_9SPHI|nr:RagB/SusD family nutrient uptake outer membrane protein [Pedobacter hiemivivus]TKC55440.1 RagB/SusD family nutrient uptake outer membrane protein [Pedobacter hiemivivus]
MKSIKIFGLLMLGIAILSSCKKFLETDTPSNFTQEVIFGTEADATKSVFSIYALFNQDAFTSRLSNTFIGNTDIEIGGVGAAPDNSRRDIWSLEATDANGDIRTVWNNAYTAINRANLCVEGLEQSKIAENPEMKQLLGESKALRALWYYWLINYWGDVPFNLKPTRGGDNFYQPRVGRDTILTTLINDLISIEPLMKPASQVTYGVERINREFVMGLISRLALCRGGYWLYPDMTSKRKSDYKEYYKIARDYSLKLMTTFDRSLTPRFQDIFDNQSKWKVVSNEDILFEVAFAPGFGDVAWNIGRTVDAGTHPYGSGSSYVGLSPALYYAYDTLDTRLESLAIFKYNSDLVQIPLGANGVSTGKWSRLLMPTASGSASAKGTGINWPIMRYTDVLLMFAESENELNEAPTAAGKAALRRVRARAFPKDATTVQTKVDNYINTVSASKETFFEAIVDERAFEFAGECIRRYDLIRWNNYGKKIVEAKRILAQMGENTYYNIGTYANLPGTVYYKNTADKKVIFYGGTFRRTPEIPPIKDVPSKGSNPDGWTAVGWLSVLYNKTLTRPADYVLNSWRGYKDETGLTPVRYILPLHSATISSSMGTLTNDGYGYGN